MRRRTLTIAAAALGSALVLSACAPSAPSGGSQTSDEEVTLKVWSWRTEDVEAYNSIFDVFEEAHPGITVEFEAFQNTEYNQILTTGLAGSDGPDVPMVRAYGQLQPNIEAGQLEPIDGKVDGVDEIAPSVLAGAKGKSDGKLYAVPLATQTLQVFYNKAIFEEHDLEVPKTWDDFIELNEDLLAAGVTPMALGAKDAWMLPIFSDIFGSTRYGGSAFEEKILDGSATFEDPDYVESLQIVADMQKYLTPDVVGVSYTDSQIQFTSGQAAQFPGGSFEIATFRTQAPELELGSYQVPLPPNAVSETPVSPAYADGNFAVNSKSENKDAAFELLNWLATPEFGQLVADELNQFSAIPGVEYSDEVMKEAWDNYQDGQAPYLLLVDFRYGEPQGTAVLGEQVQKMFLGQTDPAGVAGALQAGVSQWFVPGE
ncbi:ABC transporter substrate-binding protein [Agromyces ramosus]|uniref:Raffinose/stachyose/melibiose transport system substrate-binding protein n=1 Tax=Agromyces ramosus TaxID=33879 RepID=A0ABU0R5C4_9MICO|nr:extracellular solute-binding protein [Agromyces ramosus]MDQ0893285.1 raffinose/stachyose/melibiose transport system substrate-binding protein [Agromyces ramosus]